MWFRHCSVFFLSFFFANLFSVLCFVSSTRLSHVIFFSSLPPSFSFGSAYDVTKNRSQQAEVIRFILNTLQSLALAATKDLMSHNWSRRNDSIPCVACQVKHSKIVGENRATISTISRNTIRGKNNYNWGLPANSSKGTKLKWKQKIISCR